MEEVKICAEKTDGKIKELDKQYKGKLCKAGLALETRLDKNNRMSAERKINKGVKNWKKEIATTDNKVNKTEVKVTVTASLQKQVVNKATHQIDDLK